MIDELITLRVRPGQSIRFPGQCVACGRAAAERMILQKRRGQVTRRVEAPLCVACARQLARRSGQEESLLRMSRPAAAVVAFLIAVLCVLVLPVDLWWLRVAIGAAAGLGGGALVYWGMQRRAAAAELPEKQAAQIVDFTWRDMTLLFSRNEVAAQVRELNAELVVDTTSPADPAEPDGESAG